MRGAQVVARLATWQAAADWRTLLRVPTVETLTRPAACVQRDYLGNVSVALDCPLQDVASNRLAMPTAPLRFTVVPNVAERLSLQHGGADGAHAPAPAPALAAAL